MQLRMLALWSMRLVVWVCCVHQVQRCVAYVAWRILEVAPACSSTGRYWWLAGCFEPARLYACGASPCTVHVRLMRLGVAWRTCRWRRGGSWFASHKWRLAHGSFPRASTSQIRRRPVTVAPPRTCWKPCFLGECKLDPAIVDTGDGQFGDKFVTPRTLAAALGALVAAGLNLALPHPLPAASSCCNLFSLLADGGSTTVVAGGVHLLHCCHCYVILRHTYAAVTAEGTPRRSESGTIAAAHGNRECRCPVFLTRPFLLNRICPHQPLQAPLRCCTTLRAALLVFSSSARLSQAPPCSPTCSP